MINNLEMISFSDLFVILMGIIMGTIARFITLRIDTRQNPSYPNGYFINIVMGFIASGLGAVSIPALLEKDYAAVTFLLLAVQHFREIRKEERESLERLEPIEYAKRGSAYIDGISKTYEARNYHSMITAFITVLFLKLFFTNNYILNVIIAIISGFVTLYILIHFTKGKKIGDICDVTIGKIQIERSSLYVDGMFVSSHLGTQRSKDLFLNEGIAFVIHPKNNKFRITLDNFGQQQAILFEATRSFGVKRFKFTRKNFTEGKIIIAFVPIIRNENGILDVIKETPILENSRKVHSMIPTDIS